jgi:glycosyl transferase family 25
MEEIDVIFYINLESRIDRKEHFLSEMKKLCLDELKIVRIDAVYDIFGAIGCTKSHMKALEQFMENPAWKRCIIFEDDYTFNEDNIEINNNRLREFFSSFTDWEVLLLSSNKNNKPAAKTHVTGVEKIIYSQTTSGYCINKDSAQKLHNNFKESSDALIKFGRSVKHRYALDIYWNSMKMIRYAFTPNMGHQYANYSDIEMRTVRYNC